MNHDARFKQLLQTFFEDFIRLFFPEWSDRINFSSIEWLDKELLPDNPDGSMHRVDLIARLPVLVPVNDSQTTEHRPWLVILHVEIEWPDRTTLLKPRLPYYYFHLRHKHNLPVLPIVLYLNVALDGIGVDRYAEYFWDLEVSTFRYYYVGLPSLNGVQYVQGDNWLGVALSALMNIPRDRVAWLGAEALRRLNASPLNDQQRFFLGECVQAYLPMDEQQKEEYERLLSQDSYAGVRAMNKTVYEQGMEKGIQQGMEKGIQQGVVEIALTLLEERFGTVSNNTREYIHQLSLDALRRLTVQINKVNTLVELGLPQ